MVEGEIIKKKEEEKNNGFDSAAEAVEIGIAIAEEVEKGNENDETLELDEMKVDLELIDKSHEEKEELNNCADKNDIENECIQNTEYIDPDRESWSNNIEYMFSLLAFMTSLSSFFQFYHNCYSYGFGI